MNPQNIMHRHGRENFFVVDEGILSQDAAGRPQVTRASTTADLRKYRFSRMSRKGEIMDRELLAELARAMTGVKRETDGTVPAGYTYLGQFVDHDLTLDATSAKLGDQVLVDDLIQKRSPALDLDSVYGMGPRNKEDRRFYAPDQVHLAVGTTAAISIPAPSDNGTNRDFEGFDLPRVGVGTTKSQRQRANIPDVRNDENLAVAQTHLAFIRFHNRVVDVLGPRHGHRRFLFEAARREVVMHYQWMLRHDYLPRIVDPAVLDDVFTNGRRFFEVPITRHNRRQVCRGRQPGDMPTMPIEFSVAAFRLGHSMIRESYQWNRLFRDGEEGAASLFLLFVFSGTSGTFNPGVAVNDHEAPGLERLPSNWIADFRRLFDFTEAGRADLVPPEGAPNLARLIDTTLVDPLAQLPAGSFGDPARPPADPLETNLAFRNLMRANMVRLASGQQVASQMGIKPLTPEQILTGSGNGAVLKLTGDARETMLQATPLWFYILREAELNDGRLTGVGGRIVAETFHRAIEGSERSIVRDCTWRPRFGPDRNTFRMVDLLLFAADHDADIINPLTDTPPGVVPPLPRVPVSDTIPEAGAERLPVVTG